MIARDSILFSGAMLLCLAMCVDARGHDRQHLSDWIGDGGYRSPVTGEFCCGIQNDCVAVDPADVEETIAGWKILSRGEHIPRIEGLRSRDGRIWRCHRPDGMRRCFFYVPGSV